MWSERVVARDLAVGDKTAAELAEIHGVAQQTVWNFKMRHKPEIDAVLAGWSDEFSHIWIARKEDRIWALRERYEEYQRLVDQLYERAERATESIRGVDPEAGDVPIDLDKFRSIDIQQRKILREACEELGQLPSRNRTADAGSGTNPLARLASVEQLVQDADGNWHPARR